MALVWLLSIILGSGVSLAEGWCPGPEGRTVRIEGRFERLPDGRILAIGGDSGFDNASPPTEVDAYDPRYNRWEPAVTHMPEGRIWPFTAVLKTGQVLVVGGTVAVAPEAVRRTGWIYTPGPHGGRWAALAHPLPIPLSNTHSFMDAVTLDDGDVLIAGGFDFNSVSQRAFLFRSGNPRPEEGRWTEVGWMSAPRSTRRRTQAARRPGPPRDRHRGTDQLHADRDRRCLQPAHAHVEESRPPSHVYRRHGRLCRGP